MGRISRVTSTRKLSKIILVWLFTTALVYWPSLLSSAPLSGVSYDALFNRYGQRFLAYLQEPGAWVSAQAWQESRYKPSAVSPAGAIGVMQIMPRTGEEQKQRLGVQCSLYNAHCSILLGTHYQSRMTGQFLGRRERQPQDAHMMGLASYNCGLGCVLRAQERCNDGRLFADINNCLPAETRNYVPKIRNYFLEMTCSQE